MSDVSAPRVVTAAALKKKWRPSSCWALAITAWVGFFGVGAGTLKWERHHGVGLNGDEPHYLISAIALLRFGSFRVTAAERWARLHQALGAGYAIPLLGHRAPRGIYPAHEPGLALLMALPMLAGPNAAALTMGALISVGFVGLSFLVWRFGGERRSWPLALLGVVATPATFMALNEIYPDLLSGVILALLIAVLVAMERSWEPGPVTVALVGFTIGFLPWVHFKNLVPALLVGVGIVVVLVRSGVPRRRFVALAAGLLPPLALLVVYNEMVFRSATSNVVLGHSVSLTGTRMVGLIADQQHGVLVQQPWVVVGLAGMVLLRNRLRLSVLTATAVLMVLWFLNGAAFNHYGGVSLVGRFEWELFPILAVFATLYLMDLRSRRPRLALGILGVCLTISVVGFVVVMTLDHHSFFNQADVAANWSTGRSFGWWPDLSVFPCLSSSCLDHAWSEAHNWWATMTVLGVAGTLTAILVFWASASPMARLCAISGGVVASAGLIGILLTPLPWVPQ